MMKIYDFPQQNGDVVRVFVYFNTIRRTGRPMWMFREELKPSGKHVFKYSELCHDDLRQISKKMMCDELFDY